MFCAECGSELNDKAVVCVKCGVPLKSVFPSFSTGSMIFFCIMTFILPIIGIVIGLCNVGKSYRIGQSLFLFAFSVFCMMFWGAVLGY